MKNIIHLLVILSFATLPALGCDPELSEVFEDLESAAPGYCKAYCQQEQECEAKNDTLDEGGDDDEVDYNGYEDELQDREFESCLYDCAFLANEGDFITESVYDYTDDDYQVTYLGKVPGSTLVKFDTCIWNAGTPSCEYELDEEFDFEWYYFQVVDQEDEEQCRELEKCFEIVSDYIGVEVEFKTDDPSTDFYVEPDWCEITYAGELTSEDRSVHIDFDSFFF